MSWEQLLAIKKANKEQRAAEAAQRRVDCPIDGVPLKESPLGVRYCPMGNWRES